MLSVSHPQVRGKMDVDKMLESQFPQVNELKQAVTTLRGFVARFVSPFQELDKTLTLGLEVAQKLDAASTKLQSAESRRDLAIEIHVKVADEITDLRMTQSTLERSISELRSNLTKLNNEYEMKHSDAAKLHKKVLEKLNTIHDERKAELNVEIEQLKAEKSELQNDIDAMLAKHKR